MYFYAFVNWEQKNWIQLLPIAEFAYNISKNINIGQTLFEFNCDYYSRVFFKDKCNLYFRSFSANKLAIELKELINVCH